MKKTILFLLAAVSPLISLAGQFHINAQAGNDANPGTQAQPLKTIAEAGRRVNSSYTKGADTVILAGGVYPLTETVLFTNNKYSLESRLVIKAEIMPDDPDWSPQDMPIIASVIQGIKTPKDGDESKGLQIETSHVTIEGLRFIGSPAYYYIDGKHNRRYYPIWRDGKTLDDLVVTQCLFSGNADISAIRVAVIANGHGLVVDHCVFFNCQNSVVFWDAEGGTSYRNAMRYCLVYNGNYSGVWTTGNTADDFEFHHNIIADSHTAWISDKSRHHYSAHDCIFTGNTNLTEYGSDTGGINGPAGNSFLRTDNIQVNGKIEIEKNQAKRNYLQLKEGSFGQNLKAGLFKK
ncbi:hypothetical protein [Mucilaginibacter sp. L3T2-6]|uniref:hypothetical protein n=1 Tax=Mucilaginibacter sp. L3T2-6 TaxID=3062491 RepID=UPI002675642C|nr:hypothetical protein [Mucilaginibacter sp. L3T2-6]MDO3640815.1 hypothetical protein [Mucilaginibacter sp. L3T2-6]MDV6213709.1 hypothetical protein [Mucilaginibacter sp. L3T2-6]